MTNRSVLIAMLLLSFSNTFGQERKPATFDVASIKGAVFPSDGALRGYIRGGGTCPTGVINVKGNRASISLATLCGLIRFAYEVQEFQISGMPKWMTIVDRSLYYDIEATVSDRDGPLTIERSRELFRPLLAERFHLKFHRETRVMPIYALTVTKNGPKLNRSTPEVCADKGTRPVDRTVAPTSAPVTILGRGFYVSCQPKTSMSVLAQRLSLDTDRPVIDKTGLTGGYVFELRWAEQSQPNTNDIPPPLFTAIEEQLGLKLEATRGELEVMVIDQAERPTAN